MLSKEKIQEILAEFNFEGEIIATKYPFGEGHINDTILVKTKTESGDEKRYIVQKINKVVFKKPDEVMANIASVTAFLRDKIVAEGGDPERETLNITTTKEGALYYLDGDEEYWRCYPFIEDTITLQQAETPDDFRNAALAFGKFMLQLQDFPVEELYETIPGFHNTRKRFQNFKATVAADPVGRASSAKEEVQFVLDREADCSVLMNKLDAGDLPLRVTHNDTKLNNILLDASTGKGLCVIDLDTVMPGLAANDFGDAIRFGASTAVEDEADLTKVNFDLELYRVYAEAYLSVVGSSISKEEILSLAWGARLLTLEQTLRFLADYLEGDTYFKTAYADHNLVRTRNQKKLVEGMEAKWDEMVRILDEYPV